MSIQTLPPPFELSHEERGAFLGWWKRISSEAASGLDKADRAVLRRCDSIEAVVCTPAFHRGFNAIKAKHQGPAWSERHCDRLALLIGVAAHVKPSQADRLAKCMANAENVRSKVPVSELRFKRLLESPDLDSLFIGLRRLLPLVGNQCDMGSLAQDLFGWGEHVRKNWAYAYFAPQAAPTSESAS